MDPIYHFSRSQERPVGDPPVWWFGPSLKLELCVSRNTVSLDWKGQRQDEMKDEWLRRWFRGSFLLGPRGLPERVGPHSSFWWVLRIQPSAKDYSQALNSNGICPATFKPGWELWLPFSLRFPFWKGDTCSMPVPPLCFESRYIPVWFHRFTAG